MKNILRTELKRAFINKRFLIVFILAGISFAYGFFQYHPTRGEDPIGAVSSWQVILNLGYYGFFASVMAVLPFADSLSRDKNNHLLEPILVRTGYAQYLRAKTLAVALSGSAAVTLPGALMLAICHLIYPSKPEHVASLYFNFSEMFTSETIQPSINLNPSMAGFIAISLLLLALFGAAYALLGMGFSFLTRNQMVILGIPFVCYSFGFYMIPTSRHLRWMFTSETALIPRGNLFSTIVQYGLIGIFFLVSLLLAGKKETQVLQ